MGWARELSRVLWRSLSKRVKQPVGTDKFGNKYYYIPEYKNWRGQTIREKRIVEAATKREVDYEVGDIPTEWEAWIRRTRKTPPTVESYCCGSVPTPRIHCSWRTLIFLKTTQKNRQQQQQQNIPLLQVYRWPFWNSRTRDIKKSRRKEKIEKERETSTALFHCSRSFSPAGGGQGLEPSSFCIVTCVLS
ncbi:NADH dehydrogenase [ubiquinone] 1 alpha subcomplex assembly factor 2 isoform X1 [Erinaceus europaeus]|uniref:NADH dehydrogenase [ubiquinone] 1 alpha subcomplex assembly factor 2 isoform X1 n=1 Tax=Erinaceus europaeus TaxID=9365 RepID=A0ABM3XEN2_ERIEU|nr:NADH dehydrogenase [ubiquinone] 1 alpha subcomplex assembly factor 2 isoform X1 [Erinaceus europaeus]